MRERKFSMQQFFRRFKNYGLSSKSYGCCSLATGVLKWSVISLVLGLGLLMFNALVPWKTQDVIYFSFNIQKEIQTTLHLGRNSTEPLVKTESLPSEESNEQMENILNSVKKVADDLDQCLKIIVWFYGFLCVVRGTVGCMGVGLKDPPFIKALWFITIFSYIFDILLCAAFPIGMYILGIHLAWYIWVWMIAPLIYFPIIGWLICEMIFSYYRVLDMGGTGTEFLSIHDLEDRLLPDKETNA